MKDFSKINIVSILAAGVMLVACSTIRVVPQDFSQLYVGMPKSEAVQILGKPNEVRATHGVEYLIYNPKLSGFTLDPNARRHSVNVAVPANAQFVRVIDGKVDAYGKMGDFGSIPKP